MASFEKITIQITDLPEVIAKFENMEKRINDLETALKETKSYLSKEVINKRDIEQALTKALAKY